MIFYQCELYCIVFQGKAELYLYLLKVVCWQWYTLGKQSVSCQRCQILLWNWDRNKNWRWHFWHFLAWPSVELGGWIDNKCTYILPPLSLVEKLPLKLVAFFLESLRFFFSGSHLLLEDIKNVGALDLVVGLSHLEVFVLGTLFWFLLKWTFLMKLGVYSEELIFNLERLYWVLVAFLWFTLTQSTNKLRRFGTFLTWVFPGFNCLLFGVVAVCNSLGLDATANSRTELLHFGGGGNGGGLLGDKKSHTFTLDETH